MFKCAVPPTARAQAAEMRFSKLKEQHAELVSSHADLMKKVKSRKPSFVTTTCSAVVDAVVPVVC